MDALIICIFKGMHWKRFRPWLIPVLIAAGIKFFSFFPDAVEKYYSTGVYPLISRLLRLLFGWMPFSVGDMLYAAGFIYLVISLVRFFTRAFRRDPASPVPVAQSEKNHQHRIVGLYCL